MTLDDKLRAIRDVIQHDIGNRGLARDPQRNLINACPDDFANACRSIGEHPSPSVAIITGFYIATADPPCGETDGPLGTVFLARALRHRGISTQIITDHFCKKSIDEGLGFCGVGRREELSPSAPTDSGIFGERGSVSSPIGLAESGSLRYPARQNPRVWTIPPESHPWDVFLRLDWTESILLGQLTHIIAIERVGPANDDRCYTMRGRDITDFMCPAHRLIEYAAERFPNIKTIGIGDGGNEIGMGKIPREVIAKNIDNGDKIACRVATDHLIVAGISNWGAYGLAAGVALVRGEKLDPVIIDVEAERRILQVMVEHGPLVDGKTSQPTATVDGVAFEEYIKPLTKIREIVEDRLE